jgi:hypothetical protein
MAFVMLFSDIDGRASSGGAFKRAPPPGFDVVRAGRWTKGDRPPSTLMAVPEM